MTRALQLAHIFLALAVTFAVLAGVWGCMGLNQHVIALIDDADYALKHPMDVQTSASAHAIMLSGQAFAQDAADLMHQAAHPSKGQKAMSVVSALVPHIF